MGWSKRQWIELAFDKIGLASYTFDLTPDQIFSAQMKLDAMVSSWVGIGARISYPMASNPRDSRLDEQTSVPDYCNAAIYLNLAMSIAGSFGKAIPPELPGEALQAYRGMCNMIALPTPRMQLPNTMPLGQGNKPWLNTDRQYVYQDYEPILAGDDGPIEFQ